MIFRYTADTCNHVQYIELNVFLFSWDPKTIEHEQAEGGDLYAMPQKVNNKKGKEEEEEVAQMYSVVDKMQKQKSAGVRWGESEG